MRPSRAVTAALLLLALACEPGGGAETSASPTPPSLEADLEVARLEAATLRQALAEEQAEREALEAELERLRQRLDELAWRDEEGAPGEPAEVDRVREAFDASELALLELDDQAQREGWYGQPGYREALRDQRLALRTKLGDDRFDLLLYATGRMNRVVVTGVLEGSSAHRVGIQVGDEVLSYAGRRRFKAPELKWATLEGTAGEPVELEVLRNGSRVRTWVSRGPIGIRMKQASRPPPW